MADCGCEFEAKTAEHSRVLWTLLAVNGGMFLVEIFAGLGAESTALVGDSFDMFADGVVYAVALWAVSQSPDSKVFAARLGGYVQLALGFLGLAEVARRMLRGSDPDPAFMIGVAMLALVANIFCLRLVAAHREGGVHMRASYIFTQNDVIANGAVIVSGLAVAWTQNPVWDLAVGTGIGLLILWGACRMLKEARAAEAAL